ncbi:MAG: antitoxin AF2212-like protein [Planctomycetota bacterium]
MKHAIDAIFEHGVFRPVQGNTTAIVEGQRVRITVEDEPEPQSLQLAMAVYDGLSEQEIQEVEGILLQRSNFFGRRSPE